MNLGLVHGDVLVLEPVVVDLQSWKALVSNLFRVNLTKSLIPGYDEAATKVSRIICSSYSIY